ncbi:MAG TPA: serine/threonine-protein kinase [Planctomycetota bacterium]
MSVEARAKELFLDALEQAPGERPAFVAAGSVGDVELRERVEALLSAHERAERRLARPAAPPLVPGLAFGPYRLVAPLGEGGFGAVWRARQEEPVRREVALKVLRVASERGENLARFEIERQTLASLTHPGIARVYDGGSAHGRPWFALELIEGLEITAHVERARAPLRTRLALFADVCRALQHAHQRGVIHRDVKPSNVLVAVVDGTPVVKVIDFGIALVQGDADWTRRTLTGQLLGTPGAMSPEQLAGARDVDTRADVYALGVLLYELLVGAPPFEHAWLRARGPSEALRILREEDPPRPSVRAALRGDSARARALRGELDWIVLRCLEKDRERRYGSVAELLGDLERQERGEPVLAGPPSRLYRARKFARRHALLLSALAVSVLALALGAGAATLEARRARRAERVAAQSAEAARLESGRFQAIAEFFEHVLLSIDPAIARGRDTALLGEVLERAARGLADRVERPPEVEATLRRAIGGAYAALAQYEPALEQLERALALRRAALGPEDPATLALAAEHAGVLGQAGKHQQAEALLSEMLPHARRVLGPDDPRTLSMLSNRSTLLRSLGRTSEAIALMTELEERRARTLGPEHEDTLLVTNNLALALVDAGRLAEGAERLRRLMELQVARLGEEHPRALAAMGNYATVLDDLGRLDECEALLARVLELKLRILEPAHPSVIVSQNNLASIVERAGRLEEALELYEQALAHVRPGTDQAARLFLNHSDCLRRLGRSTEAVASAREALASALDSVGPEASLTRACDGRLADALLAAGEPREAEEAARRAHDAAQADPDAPPAERADARLRLGLALAALGKGGEARAELEAGLADPAAPSERRQRAEEVLGEMGGGR